MFAFEDINNQVIHIKSPKKIEIFLKKAAY